MAITCADLVGFAQSICNPSDETSNRSAISRAYYAALHHAIAEANAKLQNSHIVYSQSSHEQVVEQMKAGNTNAWRSAAYILRDLKTQRVEADYTLSSMIVPGDALQAVATAIKLMADISAI